MAHTSSSKETAVTEITGQWVRKPRVSEFDGLLETGQFADSVVVCEDREWKLHKAIVCPRSDYFMKAYGGNFSEASEGRIDLSCDDGDVLDALNTYLYHGQPDPSGWDPRNLLWTPQPSEIPDHDHPLRLLKVHILADKYQVEGLSRLATQKYGVDSLTKVTADLFERLGSKHMFDGPEFSSWLIAVLEDTSPTTVLRQSMFDLVLHDIELFLLR
nr:hypothetical protein B0A51_14883 [Rachicladosporium sp. CCFEE 5018]